MLLINLIKVIIETAFKRLSDQDKVVLDAYQRLQGKILRIELVEFETSVVLIFDQLQTYVIRANNYTSNIADCTIRTHFITLLALLDRDYWTQFIKKVDLEIDGDSQLAQFLVEMFNITEFDAAELLSPWLGDIVAEGIIRIMKNKLATILKQLSISREHLTLAITDEWQIVPSVLEQAWFCSEVDKINLAQNILVANIEKLEAIP